MSPFGQLTDSIRPPKWQGESRVVLLLGNDTEKHTPKKYRKVPGEPAKKRARAYRPAPWKAWTLIAPGADTEVRMAARPFVWRPL